MLEQVATFHFKVHGQLLLSEAINHQCNEAQVFTCSSKNTTSQLTLT